MDSAFGRLAGSRELSVYLQEIDEASLLSHSEEVDLDGRIAQGDPHARDRLIRAAFELLDLVSFYTADTANDATARTLKRGGTAYEAAGKVHREIQESFVRAEVVRWDALVDAGGYAGARDRGLLRTEGRDYVVEDGDVIEIKT